jgi:hypothetical protein
VNHLANTANSGRTTAVSPAFIAILSELTPTHVALLDALYKDAKEKADRKSMVEDVFYDMFDFKKLCTPVQPPDPKVKRVISSVDGQFMMVVEFLTLRGILSARLDSPLPKDVPTVKALSLTRYSLSRFGQSFVAACQSPSQPAKKS